MLAQALCHHLQGAAAEDDLEEEELEFSDDEKASSRTSITMFAATSPSLPA